MKKELTFTIVFAVLLVVTLLVINFIATNIYVTPVLSEKTKIFNSGDIDAVRGYLQLPNSNIEMDNYFALINRNRADILEMMFKEFNLSPDYDLKYEYATPLLAAAKELKPKIVSVLIKYGADVNYKDPYGVTPLMAASSTTSTKENPASLEVIKMLTDAGADINIVSEFGETAIEGALFSDDIKRVKYLVEKGGDINHLSPSGANYMFYCRYLKCFEYFLSQGFDINSVNSKGRSVFQSKHYGELPLALSKQLLAWGADICHKDNAGDTVLNYVERRGIGPHYQKEQPENYQSLIKENRASETYKYLEKKYKEDCMSN